MYTIMYKLHSSDQIKEISVPARNKAAAYDKAVYEIIPEIEGTTPYSAWIYSKTYQNGRTKLFSYTMEGMPY